MLQHLYYPAGVVELTSISKFEIKETRENGFRIHAGDRVLSLIAPSALALAEWSVRLRSGQTVEAGSWGLTGTCATRA